MNRVGTSAPCGKQGGGEGSAWAPLKVSMGALDVAGLLKSQRDAKKSRMIQECVEITLSPGQDFISRFSKQKK